MAKIKPTFPFILLMVIIFLVSLALFKPGYFSMHDDVQVLRLYEMEKCLKDGQIPCRWVPDMGAGYGHPLYNYHPVFPYYLGMIFRLFGLSFIEVVKILFFLSFLLSGVFMYIFAKEFFGNWAGLVAAAFYLLAPYHAVDVYVRGALTESWAVALFPIILWGIYKLLKDERFSFFLVSIFSLTLLFVSHNVMALIFAPLAFMWGFYWIVRVREWRKIIPLGIVFIWALGFSAFFVLPAFFEKSLVTLEMHKSGYYDYRNHFVTLKQLFLDRTWGYGPSQSGPEDNLSFQVGWPHWWVVVITGGVFIYFWLKKKRIFSWPSIFFIFLFTLAVFMTHAKSVYIWEAIPILAFVQFPWRFLAIAMLASSFLAGGLVMLPQKREKRIVFSLVLVFIVGCLNFGFFRPEKYYFEMNDEKKLSGEEWKKQSMTTLLDYFPRSVKKIPTDLAPEKPWLVEGEAKVINFDKRSNFWRLTIESFGNQNSIVELPIFDFPKWEVFVDLEKVNYQVNPETGLIRVEVPKDKRTITGWLRDTSLRKLANGTSLASFALLILVIAWQEKWRKKECLKV